MKKWWIIVPAILLCCVFGFNALWHLLSSQNLPVDLALRYWEAKNTVFSQTNIYAESRLHTYPPSANLLLYPIIVLPGYELTRYLWTILGIALLMTGTIQYSRSMSLEYSWALPVALSIQSVWMCIGIGQMSNHIVGLMMILFVHLKNASNLDALELNTLKRGLLIAYSAIKFSISLPFLGLLLLRKNSRVVVVGAAVLHILLIFALSLWLDTDFLTLIKQWATSGEDSQDLGTIDWFSISAALNISLSYALVLSLAGALLIVIMLHKTKADLLTSFLVLLVFSRFWMLHNHYDNVMLLPVLLFFLMQMLHCQKGQNAYPWIAFMLFWTSLIIPARFLNMDTVYGLLLSVFQAAVWIGAAYWIWRGTYSLKSQSDSLEFES